MIPCRLFALQERSAATSSKVRSSRSTGVHSVVKASCRDQRLLSAGAS